MIIIIVCMYVSAACMIHKIDFAPKWNKNQLRIETCGK